MRKPKKEIRLTSYEELLGIDDNEGNNIDKITEVPIDCLYDFKNHPFYVINDEKMQETVDSIKEYGVLNPCVVRPRKSGGYEIISGHRRKYACQLAGKTRIPVIIRNYTDDEATIIMVDSNIQREHILPSEKAHAYAMKYEALKHQGSKGRKNTADIVGEAAGDSGRTVQRYIRLAKLIPQLLEYLDKGELQMVSGEQLAALPAAEQKIVLDVIEYLVLFPNRQQAIQLKELSQAGKLKKETVYQIFSQRNEARVNVTISSKRIKNYFPKEYTKEQMESVIYELLEEWSHKKGIMQ